MDVGDGDLMLDPLTVCVSTIRMISGAFEHFMLCIQEIYGLYDP